METQFGDRPGLDAPVGGNYKRLIVAAQSEWVHRCCRVL